MSTKRKVAKVAIAALLLLLLIFIIRRMSSPAPELGHRDGQLTPLPDSPNCVSTQTDQAGKRMDPLPWAGDAESTLDKLEEVSKRAGGTVTERSDEYLRVEFRTRLMQYVDDVEWLIVGDRVHFRSASRVGHWDLGVNRRRMSKLSQHYLDDVKS